MAVKTKFYNLDTDTTLGGNSASDLYIASQKAVKTYVDGQIPTVNNATLTIKQNNTSKGTFTANASSNVEINLTDTTYSNFVKSGSGAAAGLVPAPSTTAGTSKYLCEDGTWATPAGTSYSGGTGISIGTGNAINHSNSVTAGTAGTSSATSGSTLNVPYVTYDAQGHVTAAGTHLHTITGFLTGITSSDVTTALGYTPYSNANPSGYQANVIETIKVNNTALTPTSKAVNITVPTDTGDLTNNAGFITSSALGSYVPTTRKVNNKALSADITLSASDVGALPSSTAIPTITFRAWS